MPADSQIIIVGAGHAGGRAAESLRTAGFDGQILLIGDEPYRPYERPSLSKELLTDASRERRVFLQSEVFYRDNRIELLLGDAAVSIDRAKRIVRLNSGGGLAYDRLLLATGSRPRRLPKAVEDGHVQYLRTLKDAAGLRQTLADSEKIILIGGGVISLEVAAAARGFGVEVTVLEALDRVMSRAVHPCISGYFDALHRRHGVEVHYGVTVSSVTSASPGSEVVVLLADGRRFAADSVLAGIGAIPNCELGIAAGLEGAGGVVVDEFCRTSDPYIFAAGEVTWHYNTHTGERSRLETWQHADRHGRNAGRNMAGSPQAYSEAPWFWSDQFGANLQVFGSIDGDHHVLRRGDAEGHSFCIFHRRSGRLVGASAVNCPRDARHIRKLVGAAVAAEPAMLADRDIDLKALVPTSP